MRGRSLPLILLTLALAGCGASPAPPSAPPATGAPATTAPAAPEAAAPFGIVADTPDGHVDLRATPGRTARVTFRVVNPGGRTRLLTLRPADAGESGIPAAPAVPATGVGAWLRVPHRVRVGPRASRAVTALLTVPRGTRPGVYNGALAAGPPAAASRASLTVRLEAAARITVEVGRG